MMLCTTVPPDSKSSRYKGFRAPVGMRMADIGRPVQFMRLISMAAATASDSMIV
jgi:hypothetical protein